MSRKSYIHKKLGISPVELEQKVEQYKETNQTLPKADIPTHKPCNNCGQKKNDFRNRIASKPSYAVLLQELEEKERDSKTNI